jgi:hypothetical protein
MRTSTTVLDMADLRDLQPKAEKLNRSTDELNSSLQTIQDKINALDLGVEVWLNDERDELSRRVIDHREERYEHYGAERIDRYRTYQVVELGYGRIGDGWALVTRTVTFEQKNERGTGWELVDDEPVEQERKPLLRAARAIRVAAIERIPALIDALHNSSQQVIDAVEKAKRLAESIE